jgi:hypothetical protein
MMIWRRERKVKRSGVIGSESDMGVTEEVLGRFRIVVVNRRDVWT